MFLNSLSHEYFPREDSLNILIQLVDRSDRSTRICSYTLICICIIKPALECGILTIARPVSPCVYNVRTDERLHRVHECLLRPFHQVKSDSADRIPPCMVRHVVRRFRDADVVQTTLRLELGRRTNGWTDGRTDGRTDGCLKYIVRSLCTPIE